MARSRRVSLSEMMGKSKAEDGSSLGLGDLQDLLGEAMPKLEFTQVGRFRLIRALKGRFGNNFRNLPGVDGIVKEFDEEMRMQKKLRKMKRIRSGG